MTPELKMYVAKKCSRSTFLQNINFYFNNYENDFKQNLYTKNLKVRINIKVRV